MNNSQVAQIMQISKSTVLRILKGNNNKYSKHKIDRCVFYKDFELNVADNIYNDAELTEICKFVAEKSTIRDGKNYDEIIRFAALCGRWTEVLRGVAVDNIAMASLSKEPFELFIDPLFWGMLNIVMKKCKNCALKKKAGMLQGLHVNIRKAAR